jgi:hypothetical protein
VAEAIIKTQQKCNKGAIILLWCTKMHYKEAWQCSLPNIVNGKSHKLVLAELA